MGDLTSTLFNPEVAYQQSLPMSLSGAGSALSSAIPALSQMGLMGNMLGVPSVPSTGTPADANSDIPTPQLPQNPTTPPDTWQPRSGLGFIGQLADAYLKSYGMEPAFENHVNEENLHDALSGYQSNPMQAIARLSKIPGQELNAIKLYQQYQSSQASSQQKELQGAAKKDLVYQRMGAMLQAATPETYPAMKAQVEKYAQNVWGMDPSQLGLPDQYDQAQLSAITNGTIKPNDVMKQGEIDKRQQNSLDLKKTAQQDLVNYRKQRLAQMLQDLNDKNNRAAASQKRLQDEYNRLHPPYGGATLQSEQGPSIQVNKTGTNAIRHLPDGSIIMYQRASDANGKINWVPVGKGTVDAKGNIIPSGN